MLNTAAELEYLPAEKVNLLKESADKTIGALYGLLRSPNLRTGKSS
jgi:hypothetical protein